MRPLAFSALFLLALSLAYGQPLPPARGLTLERLYQFPIVNGRSPAAPAMSPEGKHIVFGWNQTGERRLDVWIMDYPSGQKRRIIEAAKVPELPRQDDTRTDEQKKDAELYDGGIAGFTWAPDSRHFLFSYRGRTFVSDPKGNYQTFFDGNGGGFGHQFSPDGKFLAYLNGGNLYRLQRDTGHIKQLTFVSKPNTSVGGFQWSPDSKHLMVNWSDDSKLGRHVMMDFSKDRAEVINIRRMWHGERSIDAQVGLVPVEGGLIRFVEGIPRYHWLESMAWSPDGSFVALGWNKEDFQEFNVTLVSVPKAAGTGSLKGRTVYIEKAPTNYIPDFRSVGWTHDSRRILFSTDIHDGKFGSRALMSMEPSGRDLKPVYRENHDLAAWMRPKNSDRLILVTQERSPLQTEIKIQEPNGARKTYEVLPDGVATPTQFDDAALPLVSDDGKQIATLANQRTLNSEIYAVEPRQARLTESQLPEFKRIEWAKFEQVSFKAKDGATVYGLLITPPNLDRSKKHPAFISSLYANSAKRSWAGYFENYAAMELGMVVLQVDFRASWGQGGAFNSGYFKSMGIVDADEAVAAKEFLVSTGYVNPDRVGVWGWSYGGFLTCMIQLTRPGVFDTGVAVASVTDWVSYNEWYTRRRLGMQKDDPEIYKKTSPVHHAAGLKDNLLLIHGALDDNVLYQDTARLQQKLFENGKHFDLMLYPRDDHGISRIETRPHVFVTIMRYLHRQLTRP